MLAYYYHPHFPMMLILFGVLLGIIAMAAIASGKSGGGGKKKAKIAALQARVDALERKP
jgi:hypothetical protein